MGNRKLIIAIIVVVLLIAALIGGYLYLRNSTEQASILQEEATTIAESDLTTDEINMEIKTQGNYAVVEETMKNYLNDVRNTYLEIQRYANNEIVSEVLSAENIQADAIDLTVVEQKADEYASKLEEYQSKIQTIDKESSIMSLIEEKELSDYYIDIYENIMLSDAVKLNLANIKSDAESTLEEAWEKIDALDEVIEFLKDNTRYWDIEDGKIQFTNVNKLTEYYSLLNGAM